MEQGDECIMAEVLAVIQITDADGKIGAKGVLI